VIAPPFPDARQAALNSEPFHHLYVHIPFCRHKCGYCDFNAYARLDGLIEPYVDALLRELGWVAAELPFAPLDTIYFGGGTPGLIPAPTFQRLMRGIRAGFDVSRQAEIPWEANPASTDPRKLAAWRESGVNRLSIGVQGFDPRALAVLERRSDAAQAREVVRQAREAGFKNLSLDLIGQARLLYTHAGQLEAALGGGPQLDGRVDLVIGDIELESPGDHAHRTAEA